MDIRSIEQLRNRSAISQRDLCRAAEVHETTYSALKAGRRSGNVATVERLRAALDALIAEKDAGHGVVAHARSDSDQGKESHGR